MATNIQHQDGQTKWITEGKVKKGGTKPPTSTPRPKAYPQGKTTGTRNKGAEN